MGLSISQLSTMYRKEKQFGGRFMCCSTVQEVEFVTNYIRTHQREFVRNLSHLGVRSVVVTTTHRSERELGRFIISFKNKNDC